MKKYSILLAIVALVLASLACQTIMGGGDNGFEVPDVPEQTDGDDLEIPTLPSVEQDGGDITFHGFDRGVVYLHMQGACAGCPSSTLTLKMGIENLLRHYIPEVTEVRPVA